MAPNITKAQFSALNAVRNRRCYRRYTSEGNTVHNKDGGAASVLWKLEKMGFIREISDGIPTIATFGLTDAGRLVLRQAEEANA